MPIDLVSQAPSHLTLHRPTLVFAAQLVAILMVAGLTIALGSLPGASIVGSAQEIVAGP